MSQGATSPHYTRPTGRHRQAVLLSWLSSVPKCWSSAELSTMDAAISMAMRRWELGTSHSCQPWRKALMGSLSLRATLALLLVLPRAQLGCVGAMHSALISCSSAVSEAVGFMRLQGPFLPLFLSPSQHPTCAQAFLALQISLGKKELSTNHFHKCWDGEVYWQLIVESQAPKPLLQGQLLSMGVTVLIKKEMFSRVD